MAVRSLLATLAALTLLSAALAQPPPQPVTNGGFEAYGPDGQPLDWSVMGPAERTADAHSGASALLLTRVADERGEVGLNRVWAPDDGRQGTMLAELRGGIRFWYKVPEAVEGAKLAFYAIAMSARPMEDTGAERAVFEVPTSHYGDGRWHEGAVVYDYTATPGAKWVHLSPRLMQGACQWILDDVEWAASIGPWLSIPRLEVLPGRDVLRATLRNSGDRPIEGLTAEVAGPEGVTLTPVGESVLPPSLQPARTVHLHWRVAGDVPDGEALTLRVRCADGAVPEALVAARPRPQLLVYSLEAEKPVLRRGEETVVRVSAYNIGAATQADVRLQLEVPSELRLVGSPPAPVDVPPRSWSTQTFTVRARIETPNAQLLGRVTAGGRVHFVRSSIVVGETGGAAYELGRIRLRVASSRWGAGPIAVEVPRGRGWSQAAWVPYLARVVFRNAEGADETLYPEARPVAGGGCRFTLRAVDAEGGIWTGVVGFAPGATPDSVRAYHRIACDRPRQLRCFEGPVVWALTQGRDALFPGLEWTEGDEVTSSSLDIVLGHADQVRHVPHPQKIAIPLMAVSDGATTVGLLWDCRKAWDGRHDRPAAFFSAPGYLEGHRPATMGLMAPSILGGWLRENERLAGEPYPLAANRPLTLEATLLARVGSSSSLDAVDRWIETFGAPEPSRPPRGDYLREVEFSAQAYLDTVYIPEEDAWWYSKGGGPVMSKKGPASSAYAWNLLRAARLAQSGEKAARFLEWAGRMRAQAAEPSGADQGLEFLTAPTWPPSLLASAASLSAAQLPEGGWSFDADRSAGPPFTGYDYWDLGEDDAVESGTIAASAAQLLRCARVLGSESALAGGLRALEALESYRVPRAAQVWEVPVHSPDILASADALEAYLEAYAVTGDARLLERAVYWARTGLPFLYLWEDPERPFLRYASIPVYGASQNQWSWFGRPVQWNGLRYAGALFQLAPHDDSLPWRTIAEGIVVSALHQQAPDGPDKGMWPDSIGAIQGDKSSWVFDPQLILEHVYTLLGQDPHPRTVRVAVDGATVPITSIGEVSAVRHTGATLRCTVSYAAQVQGAVLFGCLAAPTEVLLNGEAVPRGDGRPGWAHDPSLSLLTVRLPAGPAHRLELRGVRTCPAPEIPLPLDRIDFTFEAGTEGWSPLHSVSGLRAESGALVVEISDVDPYIQRQGLHLTGRSGDTLALRMRSNAAGGAQLYWSTRGMDYYEEAKVLNFAVVNDGHWHEYRLPLGGHALWAGQEVTGLRFDPAAGGPGDVEIDWMRLERE